MWFRRTRAAQPADGVDAEIHYSSDRLVRPRIDASEPARTLVSLHAHRVRVHDARGAAQAPALGREGFTLLTHHSAVTDFGHTGQHAAYCAALERLLRELTGSPQVFLSPLLILRSRNHPREEAGLTTDAVADAVHADRTDRSVRSEARRTLQTYGIETIPEGRLVAYNLWRALTPPPQDCPLALCDLRTVREEHLVPADSAGNQANGGAVVEFYLAHFDPAHRWSYYPNLTRDELLVFQQYDTEASGPSGCLHTAFRDPACKTAVVTRQSIEARAYVFFPS